MEAEELDIQLDELEIRVERLRSLYEQYFLGIEKLEPAVPRKDVDRRIWVLRRSQIRNTAKRFRLHNIIQRYNTFQQYWQRICREIENGTYTRHLLRAVRRLGDDELLTIAARRRFGIHRTTTADGPDPLQAALGSVEAELDAELRRVSKPPPPEDEFEQMLRSLAPSAPPLLPVKVQPGPDAGETRRSRSGLGFVEARSLGRQPHAVPSTLMQAVVISDSANRPAPPVASTVRSAPPLPPAAALAAPPPAPPVASTIPRAPREQPRPSLPATGTRWNGRQDDFPQGPPGIWTSPGEPRTRPRPLPSRPAPTAPKRDQMSAPQVSPEIRDLHTQLMRARDQTGDPTRVSVEALAKTLDATSARLREQHGAHRRIGFEVVIKEGKALVRPIVR